MEIGPGLEPASVRYGVRSNTSDATTAAVKSSDISSSWAGQVAGLGRERMRAVA